MCEGRVFDVAGLRINSRYERDSTKVMIDKYMKAAGAPLVNDISQAAYKLEGGIKNGISQAPVPASGAESYQDLKDTAKAGVGTVTEKYNTFKRKKVVKGTEIPIFLVSTSPGGAKSAFANSFIEFGRGRLPGSHPWLTALLNQASAINVVTIYKSYHGRAAGVK